MWEKLDREIGQVFKDGEKSLHLPTQKRAWSPALAKSGAECRYWKARIYNTIHGRCGKQGLNKLALKYSILDDGTTDHSELEKRLTAAIKQLAFIAKRNVDFRDSHTDSLIASLELQSDPDSKKALADLKALQRAEKQTKTFSADVAIQWMNMQVWQMYKYPGIVGNAAYSRHYAYSGIALYEAVVPGMPAYQSIAPQLNGLSGLPKTKPGAGYHWAASANAALASINKKLFPAASPENKAAMDDLEATLLAQYSNEADAAIIERSVAFGKAVAEAVFNWADTDGHQNINNPYTPPADKIGGVYWTPPPVLPVHSLQYFGNIRRIVATSGDGAGLPAPPYNELEAMTIEVINAKPAPGTDEFKMAFWWRDFPGTSTPGHYVSILRQVLQKENATYCSYF
mgnify:CR=1 FL=1